MTSSLSYILDRLSSLHPQKIDLSLGRLERLLALLGHPERTLPPIVHIAGTNGKGSTQAFLRAICEMAGMKVHAYTSPHLVRFEERIRLCGRMVSCEALCHALIRCEEANEGHPITFFEMTTAAAFLLFHEHPADLLLLEVGLGGRYDATNVISSPLASLITPISLDHQEFLGNTLSQIAYEKAGILKPHVPAFIAHQPQEARSIVEKEAARLHIRLYQEGKDFQVHEERKRLVYEDENGLLDLPLPRLLGRHQHQNAALALATIRHMMPQISLRAMEEGLCKVEWPARLQRLSLPSPLLSLLPQQAEVWVDGGHNEGGGHVLSAAMAEMEEAAPRPLILICGMLAHKDMSAFLASFQGLAQEICAIPIPHASGSALPETLVATARNVHIPAMAFSDIFAALAYLNTRHFALPPRILITGSLYLAGYILSLLENPIPPPSFHSF